MRLFGLLTSLLLVPTFLLADADRQDWLGEYAMNHDGHVGTLRISASQRKCFRLPCPGLDVQYSDDHGVTYTGAVDVLDENGQHMAFTINFPGNPQVFNVYIFSFDKSKIAGTTVWGGRMFGVLATKSTINPGSVALAGNGARLSAMVKMPLKNTVSASGSTVGLGEPTRTVRSDGSIELRYPDGTVRTKRIGSCGWTVQRPDGTVINPMCTFASVHPVIPPPPPAGSPEELWLKGQDTELLDIIQTVLGGADSAGFQNYQQAYENPSEPLLYKRVYYRTRALAELTSTPR